MNKIIILLLSIVLLAPCISLRANASDCVPGDVNGDEKIDGRDLIRLKQYLSGKDVAVIEENADMNGDTRIDGRDAIRLAQYLAGQGRSDDPDSEYPEFDPEYVIEQARIYAIAQGYKWDPGMISYAGYQTRHIYRTKDEAYAIKKLKADMDVCFNNDGDDTFFVVYKGIVERYINDPEYVFWVYCS